MVTVTFLQLIATTAMAQPGEVQCVECSVNDNCTSSLTGTACFCSIRFFGATKICREHGFCDFGCDDPGMESGQYLPVNPAAIEALYAEEPLLALVLLASVIDPDDTVPGGWALDVSDYGGGSLTVGSGVHYRHHGSFERTGEDGVHFRLFVDRAPGGDGRAVARESFTFTGRLGARGREVEYAKVWTGEDGEPAVRESHSWSYRPTE